MECRRGLEEEELLLKACDRDNMGGNRQPATSGTYLRATHRHRTAKNAPGLCSKTKDGASVQPGLAEFMLLPIVPGRIATARTPGFLLFELLLRSSATVTRSLSPGRSSID